jgi:hypothetical protein
MYLSCIPLDKPASASISDNTVKVLMSVNSTTMKKRILDKQNSRYLSPLDTLSCFKETFSWNCFMALGKIRFFDFFDKTKNLYKYLASINYSTDNLIQGIYSKESIPGLPKRLQIRAQGPVFVDR